MSSLETTFDREKYTSILQKAGVKVPDQTGDMALKWASLALEGQPTKNVPKRIVQGLTDQLAWDAAVNKDMKERYDSF